MAKAIKAIHWLGLKNAQKYVGFRPGLQLDVSAGLLA